MRGWLTGLAWISIGVGAMAAEKAAKSKPAEKKDGLPTQSFKDRDKNKDGKISLDEFTAGYDGKLKEAREQQFKARDENKDGFLSEEEFKADVRNLGKKKKTETKPAEKPKTKSKSS